MYRYELRVDHRPRLFVGVHCIFEVTAMRSQQTPLNESSPPVDSRELYNIYKKK